MENFNPGDTDRFVDNATSKRIPDGTSRNTRACLKNATTSVYNFLWKISRNITLENVRTIISVSLDVGRLIDRGNAFAMS